MAVAFERSSTRALLFATALAGAMATSAVAQDSAPRQTAEQPSSAKTLRLPQNLHVFGNAMPSVIKATAIVNGDVITQTDVDQRLAFLAIANNSPIPADQVDALRQQVLRNLIDETLEIQAAKAEKIEVKASDIDRTVQRVATNAKQNPDQLKAYLEANGSSIKSLRKQIEGEIAWTRLQHAKIESEVSVGDDEVKAVLSRLTASKGTEEYHVGEIFLSATPDTQPQTLANAQKIIDQLKGGASFAGYARQYSEASTAAVGGDLGWVRPEQLPTQIAAILNSEM